MTPTQIDWLIILAFAGGLLIGMFIGTDRRR